MNSEDKRILKLFQCEDNRLKEQDFARGFTQNKNVNLAFINEGRAFTDGINITVDPADDNVFADDRALQLTSEKLGFAEPVRDRWAALFLMARSREIHECLHIIFTQFPPPAVYDKRSTDRIRVVVLAMIDNIIEDAFIENAGVSEFPDTEIFLRWGRVSRLYAQSPSQGTVSRALEFAMDMGGEAADSSRAIEYILNYCLCRLLYPMFKAGDPDGRYASCINRIYPLFFEGSVCGTPKERHEYACMIFDILEPLLPKEVPEFRLLAGMLGGTGTHSSVEKSFSEHTSEGQSAQVTRRLFTDMEGEPIEFDENGEILVQLISDCQEEYQSQNDIAEVVIQPYYVTVKGSETGASAMHRGIEIKEYHPGPDALLEKSYGAVVRQYQRVIDNYRRRFARLIHTENEYIETKQYFGAGISSKDFIDKRKRYWYKKYYDENTPELAVILMIDGSGSMQGVRRNAAVQATVVLHEVLESQNIQHCIVEHRAVFGEPLVEHNVLLDFRHKAQDKYNIMRLSAHGGTREGLSLYWAQKYIHTHSSAQNKVIIAVSDGFPAHDCDKSEYLPPVSIKDTANAVERISRSSTRLVAVALGEDCYEDLKDIYPKTALCTDLEKLTGQLLKIISEELNR